MSSAKETFMFNADIQQLMSLIINTFYSNKDVFLRELISNASDAIDKIRHESLTDRSKLDSEKEFYIRIIPDKVNNTLTIRDTGIGMTKMDLINNLGTIARSGTKQFMEAVQSGADASMIGQFGVGFYSAYLVADKVVVISKHNDDDQYIWQSGAGSSFTVDKDTTSGERLGRGTAVILHMKEDQLEYLEERRIEELVRRHSGFISFPIQLSVEKQVEKEVTDSEGEEVEDVKMDVEETSNDKKEDGDTTITDADATETKDEEKKEEKKKKKKKVTEVKREFQLLNKNKPLWLRNPSDVTHEEYAQFYKSLTNAWEDHLAVKHFSVEGQLEFKCLLFVPTRPPYELFDAHKKHNNIKLYVRRVFIKDDCEDLVPDWLRFIYGFIDSEDLPLNISREALQHNKILKLIRKTIVKKSIELFEEIAETRDFKQFHENFSIQLRYGIHEDSQNRAKLANLIRYKSTKTPLTDNDELVSFKTYCSRMRENQKYIYYITGHSLEAVANSPSIEELKHRNIEVLFMVEPIDEYVVQQLKSYEGKELKSCTRSQFDLELGDEEKKEKEALEAEFQPFCTFITEVLSNTPNSNTLEKVCCSRRLRQSPVVVVTGNNGWSANMERIARAQALRDKQHSEYMKPRKTFEINPINPIIKELKRRFDVDKSDKTIKDLIILLYQTALLQAGFIPDNPNDYASKVYRMLLLGLAVDDDTDEQMPQLDEVCDAAEVSKMEEVD